MAQNNHKKRVPSPPWRCGAAQYLGDRGDQQDAVGTEFRKEQEPMLLAIVADGMGGLARGGEFSTQTVREMCRGFMSAEHPQQHPTETLAKLALDANQKALLIQEEGKEGGTTLLAVLLCGRRLSLLSVGDSRIDLFRKGALLQINRQHTLGTLLDEKACLGMIDEDDARDNAYRHALSSYIGAKPLRFVDLPDNPVRLLHGDRVVMMTDGVFGLLDDADIIAAIEAEPDPQSAAKAIIRRVAARDGRGKDNASVLIISIL